MLFRLIFGLVLGMIVARPRVGGCEHMAQLPVATPNLPPPPDPAQLPKGNPTQTGFDKLPNVDGPPPGGPAAVPNTLLDQIRELIKQLTAMLANMTAPTPSKEPVKNPELPPGPPPAV